MTTEFTAPRPAEIDAIMLEARRLRAEAVRSWSRTALRWTLKRLSLRPNAMPNAA